MHQRMTKTESKLVFGLTTVAAVVSVVVRTFFPIAGEQMEVRILYILVSIVLAVIGSLCLWATMRS